MNRLNFSNNRIEFTFCHRKPERSFFWKGKQLPVCARCTGINLGYIALPLFIFGLLEISPLWSIILIIPTYVDGALQAFFNIESNNYRRFITGLLSGIGTMSLVSIVGRFIGEQILLITQ